MSGILLPRSGLSIKHNAGRIISQLEHLGSAPVAQKKKIAQDIRARQAGQARWATQGGNPIYPRRDFLANRASHAAGSMALVDSFGILLGRETTNPEGETPKTQASLVVKRVKLLRSRPTVTQVAI